MLEIGVALAQPATIHRGFQVNTNTSLNQEEPVVAIAGDGSFVVVWQGFSALSDDDVFARRFDSAGSPLGAEFRVNDYTPAFQAGPVVAMASDGAFVVAWYGFRAQGNGSDVMGRRFSPSGEKLAEEFQVNVYMLAARAPPR
jgi:hypothetical protein